MMYLKNGTFLQGERYKIVRHINSGGFGNTYEGIHVMLDKRVAIKEFFVKDFCNRDETTSQVTTGITAKTALVSKLRKKFIDEARSLCKLEHPNIVHVYDVFEENGTAYYVMDYIDGKSVHEILKTQSSLPESLAVKYICQVAHALQYVHEKNRLHLDIKPGNIMIDTNDNAILIDFGASKQYDEEAGENTSTLLGKTPGYAPIEQMGNSVQTFTPATDIYALGATLYKMLSGITPPESTILVSDDDALKPLPSHITLATRKAVECAMRVKRNERPQDVETWLKILDDKTTKQETVTPKRSAPSRDDEQTIVEEPRTKPVRVTAKVESKPKRHYNKAQPEKEENSLGGIMLGVLIFIFIFIIMMIIKNSGTNNPSVTAPHKVDLGLSVYWADCNIGASSPEESGFYFAWGETSSKKRYLTTTSKTLDKQMGDIAGNVSYDAATANLGGNWRLPSRPEIEELKNKCKWEWTISNGKKGYKVTGPNGNSIFLPTTGKYNGQTITDEDGGQYWTSSPNSSFTDSAWYLYVFYNDSYERSGGRWYGRTVRPVSAK